MRLFHQLSEQEQEASIHHCLHMVLDDVITEGLQIDPETEGNEALVKALADAMEKVKATEDEAEKVRILMDDDTIGQEIYDMAVSMAHGAYYHDPDELVIFPEELLEDENDINNDDTESGTNNHSLN